MNLNDTERFRQLDPEDMIGHINSLPDQLWNAWHLGQQLDLPAWEGIDKVVVAGMGGSAIGGDLLKVYAASHSPAVVAVHRDYDLPAWASGENTLVICSSHSGNTEETLSAFEAAQKQGCRVLALTTGGALAELAKKEAALWQFTYHSQPRAAIHHSLGLLLAAMTRLGLLPDPAAELEGAVDAMKAQQESLLPDVPDIGNSAKRMAGQFYGRWVTIFGSGILRPVARRWKTQINEVAKAYAAFEELPEADHNTLQGVVQPEEQMGKTMAIFLRAAANHPRNQLRDEFTRIAMMVQGINTDFIKAQGETPLANMWTALHYGDYTAYYLAMAYGLDPTPVPMLQELKEKLKAEGNQ
ncbi:MAG: bifunctional phosphoglucose/phosphomannose isomerase [Anaerolineae bacterium]|nr:bifunctional phosphoglucose/phosphomannose isomerase [Anaerolineae bacterium]